MQSLRKAKSKASAALSTASEKFAAVPGQHACDACGTSVAKSVNFCPTCGTAIVARTRAPSAPSSTTAPAAAAARPPPRQPPAKPATFRGGPPPGRGRPSPPARRGPPPPGRRGPPAATTAPPPAAARPARALSAGARSAADEMGVGKVDAAMPMGPTPGRGARAPPAPVARSIAPASTPSATPSIAPSIAPTPEPTAKKELTAKEQFKDVRLTEATRQVATAHLDEGTKVDYGRNPDGTYYCRSSTCQQTFQMFTSLQRHLLTVHKVPVV
uniref:C2H2-type domain-containing protein n=1 Tax=Sexangularia sp. CB-2014 TaxID=1486929 RepID=A0A7S1VP72_9EUKA